MTSPVVVSEITPRVDYAPGTPTTDFAVPFPFDDIADLDVVVNGTSPAWSLVSGVQSDGLYASGTVRLATAATGAVSITRSTGLRQKMLAPTNGQFRTPPLNTELSRLWMAQQDEAFLGSRALRMPLDEPAPAPIPGRLARANRVVGFNSTGALSMLSLSAPGFFIGEDIRNYGVVQDGTDQTLRLQACADAMDARGGGEMYLPAGVTLGTVIIGKGVQVIGAGPEARLAAPAGAQRGVIETKWYRELTGLRVQNASATAAGTVALPVPGTLAPSNIGDTIYLPLRVAGGGAFAGYHVTSIAGLTPGVMTMAGAVPAGLEFEPFAPIFNGMYHGPEAIGIYNLTLDGNAALAPDVNNIAQAQTMTGGAALTLNGAAINMGRAVAAWANNLPLIVTTSALNVGRTLTITGTRRNKDLSVSAQTEVLPIDGALKISSAKYYETITSIVPSGSGALNGQITVGWGDGLYNRSGISLFGARWEIDSVYVTRTRGFALDAHWIVNVAGFISFFANQQGFLGRFNADRNDCGGIRANGPVDSFADATFVNYPVGDGIYASPLCPGTVFGGGHINGGNIGGLAAVTAVSSNSTGTTLNVASAATFLAVGDAITVALDAGGTSGHSVTAIPTASTVTISPALPSQASTGLAISKGVIRWPNWAVRIEAENTGITNRFKVEGFKVGGVLGRANNFVVDGAQIFYINSQDARIPVQIGDNANGWPSCAGYTIRYKHERCSAGLAFDNDGGLGLVDVHGWDIVGTVTSNSTGTTVNVPSASYAVGNTIYVGLDAGGTSTQTVTAIPNATSLTVSPGLPSQASTGRAVYRGTLFTGTYATGEGSSRITMDVRGTPQGSPVGRLRNP